MTLNCAVIGMGVGKKHADFINKSNYLNLMYICEKDPKKISKYKSLYKKTKWVTNDNKIFNDNLIDLIVIASYDNYHFSQIKKSLIKKKYIFCEKPICQNINQLKKINHLLNNNKNTSLNSNLVLRSVEEFIKIHDILEKKKIGKIYYAEADYNYGRVIKLNGWRSEIPFYSVFSGGGIHMVDQICLNVNDLPVSVTAYSNKISTKNSKFKYNDFTVCLLKFKDNKIAKITANFGSVTNHHHSLKFYGTKGTIFKDYSETKLIFNRDKEKSKVIKINKTLKYNKSNLLKQYIDFIERKKKYKTLPNQNYIINLMLICLAVDYSIKKNKEIKINYKNISLK